MRTCVLAILLSTAAGATETTGVRVTSGWLSVLDVPGARMVATADTALVAVAAIGDQVLLQGVVPGETTVSVWTGSARIDYPVTVMRDPTIQPFDGLVRVSVEHLRRLRGASLQRVAVGDASICDAVLHGADELELRPRRAGTTTVVTWAGGEGAAQRRQLLVTVESGGVVRSLDDLDAVLTEPLDGRLVLIAGERAIIDAPVLAQFEVLDPSVAQVHVGQHGELVVEGRAAGATRVLVWTGARRPQSHFVVVHPRTGWEREPDDEPPPEPPPLPVNGGVLR